ncbi:hypothetical protein N9137_00795 [Pseudomonadales bacterium]|nr:hypothetical protein [Pseudomonadales bacterium]
MNEPITFEEFEKMASESLQGLYASYMMERSVLSQLQEHVTELTHKVYETEKSLRISESKADQYKQLYEATNKYKVQSLKTRLHRLENKST